MTIDEELRAIFDVLYEDFAATGVLKEDVATNRIKDLITTKQQEAYRQGYNDNSRDCTCGGARVPHKHLLDDGESHDIRPDVAAKASQTDQPNNYIGGDER